MTMSEHAKPLSPGEIRTHTVGGRTFQVMHIMNGGMTQASYRDADGWGLVLKTDRFDSVAVRAYAEAIAQAEADHADADREDDAPEPLTAEGEEALRVRAGFAPAPTLADDVATLRSDLNTGMGRIRSIGRWSGSAHEALEYLGRAAETLDRIAGAVPQRATDEQMGANTPAEARTGTSDRVAAALNELAALRAKLHPTSAISTYLVRIEATLRGTDA